MGRTIAVANQKGGVGKSTTAINLSACLAEQGKKVLTIDMDPQGNTTSGLGVDKNEVEDTLYELLVGQSDVEKTIVKDVVENVDLIPSNVNLSGAEIELVKLMAACGLILGWQRIILAFLLGCICGSVIHLLRMKLSGEGRVLAMGPYLAAGIFLVALFGQQWIGWYLSLLGI